MDSTRAESCDSRSWDLRIAKIVRTHAWRIDEAMVQSKCPMLYDMVTMLFACNGQMRTELAELKKEIAMLKKANVLAGALLRAHEANHTENGSKIENLQADLEVCRQILIDHKIAYELPSTEST